jgi:glycosyltransferase involved in cell wall biosynthesis
MQDARLPAATLIIPAHNEANVIGRLLDQLPTSVDGRPLQIIVACNGCTDRTAEVARRPGVTVLQVSKASKIAALNEADAIAEAFPRLYIDADLMLTQRTITDLVTELSRPGLFCAAPPYRLQIEGRPWLVRAYFKVWLLAASLRDQYVGSGIYALSREGRARFERFPNVIADDTYVRNLFTGTERRVIATDPTTVEAPRTLAAVVRRKIRVNIGNLELAARPDGHNHRANERSGKPWWRAVLSRPALIPAGIVYGAVNAWAALIARRRFRTVTGAHDWGRDDTTRTTPVSGQ